MKGTKDNWNGLHFLAENGCMADNNDIYIASPDAKIGAAFFCLLWSNQSEP